MILALGATMKKYKYSFFIYYLYFASFSAFAFNQTGFKAVEMLCKGMSEKASITILSGVSGRSVSEMLKDNQGAKPKAIDIFYMPAYKFGKSIGKVKSGINYVKDINRELNDSCMSHLVRFTGKIPDDKSNKKRWEKESEAALMEVPDIFATNYDKWLENPSTLEIKLSLYMTKK